MAPPVKRIQGTIILPSGGGWPGDALYIRPTAAFTVAESASPFERRVLGDREVMPISSAGAVSFDLVPNDLGIPGDTVYIVQYSVRGAVRFTENWIINSAHSSPIEIGDVTRVVAVTAGFVPATFKGLTDTAVDTPSDGDLAAFVSATGKWTSQAPGSGSDADAIHDNVGGEIKLITEKTVALAADLLVIESDADTDAKRRLTVQNLRRLQKYTSAARPAANAANDGLMFRVKDAGKVERWEVIYEKSAGGVFAYWPFIAPFG